MTATYKVRFATAHQLTEPAEDVSVVPGVNSTLISACKFSYVG